jgi:iron complex transport system ATP-binding protein
VTLAAAALTIAFPGRILVRGLSFEVRPGQCWAVLGNNGSGKTSLLHALAGVRRPSSGQVELDGAALSILGAGERARRIGLLMQEEPVEFWGSVLDYVCLGRYPHRRALFGWDAQDEHLARAQLERMDLALFADRAFASLSGGERQRARLALVLTQDPSFYLMDEPLQHLDLRHQALTLQCLASLACGGDRAVVMVLHDPRLARDACDHALLLFDADAPLAGPAGTVLTSGNLERLYGVPVPL